jgi:hypothetical protein
MKQAKVQYDNEKDPKVFSNLQDLDLFLDEIQYEFKNKDPIIASIETDELYISLGLGKPQSFVQVINQHNQPPYWITLGDNNRKGVATFFFQVHHHTEIPLSYLIPISKARDVIRELLMTGLRSNTVSWVEV